MGPVDVFVQPPVAFTGGQWAVILGILFVGLALHAWLVFWLYRDVRETGKNAAAWAGFGAVAFIPTIVAWRFVRPEPVRPAAVPRGSRSALTDGTDRARTEQDDPYRLGVHASQHERPAPDAVRGAIHQRTGAARPRGTEVSCPRCAARFEAPRDPDGGPTRVQCPGCGAVGHV